MTPRARRPSRRALVATLAALAVGALALVVWRATRPDPVPERPVFSGERALADVYRQVAFGPRIPGTPEHRAMRAWLRATLDSLGATVNEQAFRYAAPRDPSIRYDGVNVLARFHPERTARVMLAAHYDTRAVADEDPDPARRTEPVPGANDGGSGVAVLVEIARLVAQHGLPGDAGLDLIFFDVEDAGEQLAPDEVARLAQGGVGSADRVPFAIGSQAFVAANPGYRPRWGLVIDMVGDPGLRIPIEGYSYHHARPLMHRVWQAAHDVGATAFVNELGPAIEDDHIAFLQSRIPVGVLIHAPFPETWHTTADTPENVSAESLGQVGRVLVELLWGARGAASAAPQSQRR